MKISQLNKLAFICNLAFLLAMAMRYYPVFQGSALESVILVSGLVLSPVINLTVLYFNFRHFNRPGFQTIRPLALLNTVLLVLQVFLFLSGTLSLGNTNA
ncbi:hypothetical protein ACFSQD_03210 [Flavihumibacter stibioxidans]|uniref:Uncharacterized protein n=1 Tax=Flavihumibacter stibioxidans TaxID=1834163 RepID=A0ABR7MDQ3_9BACT|nr:hypothetical protein [Flavihumibacter stibioxidans]MBC6493158.1 hypothetical protein [Flavihumibacter stibioxidans]